jgi:hypothetical protein
MAVKMRSTAGAMRHLHLTRTARLAGEAFAFADPEADLAPARRLPLGGLAWTFLAVAALAGLYIAS